MLAKFLAHQAQKPPRLGGSLPALLHLHLQSLDLLGHTAHLLAHLFEFGVGLHVFRMLAMALMSLRVLTPHPFLHFTPYVMSDFLDALGRLMQSGRAQVLDGLHDVIHALGFGSFAGHGAFLFRMLLLLLNPFMLAQGMLKLLHLPGQFPCLIVASCGLGIASTFHQVLDGLFGVLLGFLGESRAGEREHDGEEKAGLHGTRRTPPPSLSFQVRLRNSSLGSRDHTVKLPLHLTSRLRVEFEANGTAHERVFEDALADEEVFFDGEEAIEAGLH